MNADRFLAAGAALLLCACSGSSSNSSTAPSATSSAPPAPPRTYTLVVTVIKDFTQDPTSGRIANATVNVSGSTTKTGTTDAAGQVSFAGVPGGSMAIMASAPGYIPFTITANVMDDNSARQSVSLATPTACPTLGFDDLTVGEAVVTTSSTCGLTLRTTLGDWFVKHYGNGNPAPAINFQQSPVGATIEGEVQVSAGGRRFRFLSVDLSADQGSIPYAFTGISGSTTVFTTATSQFQPFHIGSFVTVTNPQSSVLIDSLIIRLTNHPGQFVPDNVMSIDNIRVSF